MAGFECTDKLNCYGERVDFINVTKHLDKVNEDYSRVALLQFKTVREGIRWSMVEKQPYVYNFTDVEKLIVAARENDIQIIWDICHFGFPDDLSPLHPMFARRFAAVCSAFVKFYRSIDPTGTLIITPFNEVSFLSWLGGDVCGTTPFCRNYGWEVKYNIMKAYIEGIEAIKATDEHARILTTEPLVNMVPPLNATEAEVIEAANRHESQFQVLDMLSGKLCPELRGRPEYVDIIGCNYYYNNQWISNTCEFLRWANDDNDPRWKPLSALISQLYERYQRPIVLTETSHPLEDRPHWLNFVTDECKKAIEAGVPLWGICWYPIVDRPDWDKLTPWHRAGIWDVNDTDPDLPRLLHEPTAMALVESQKKISEATGLPSLQGTIYQNS